MVAVVGRRGRDRVGLVGLGLGIEDRGHDWRWGP